ncbi:hypothetical protein V493_01078 [Pseudogymnoascus sp. VKM F-4281 (FW-2241)]|nr:hypothetical protein V493_01078 [Pseudogymnoascus sp. VKM F-4281 (FW-2241)]
MFNTTYCSSSSDIPNPSNHLSCSVQSGPNNSLYDYGALDACCPSPASIQGFGDGPGIVCYAYCNNTSVEEAEETQWCMIEYFRKRPQNHGLFWKCNTAGNRAGAATRGRASAWGGLVMLSLVVSATVNMP